MTGLRGNYWSHDDFTLERDRRDVEQLMATLTEMLPLLGSELAEQEKRI